MWELDQCVPRIQHSSLTPFSVLALSMIQRTRSNLGAIPARSTFLALFMEGAGKEIGSACGRLGEVFFAPPICHRSKWHHSLNCTSEHVLDVTGICDVHLPAGDPDGANHGFDYLQKLVSRRVGGCLEWMPHGPRGPTVNINIPVEKKYFTLNHLNVYQAQSQANLPPDLSSPCPECPLSTPRTLSHPSFSPPAPPSTKLHCQASAGSRGVGLHATPADSLTGCL